MKQESAPESWGEIKMGRESPKRKLKKGSLSAYLAEGRKEKMKTTTNVTLSNIDFEAIAGVEACTTLVDTDTYELCLLKTTPHPHFSDFQLMFSHPTIWLLVSREPVHLPFAGEKYDSVDIVAVIGKEDASTSATSRFGVIKDLSYRWGEVHISHKVGEKPYLTWCNPFGGSKYPLYFEGRHKRVINEIERALGLKETEF